MARDTVFWSLKRAQQFSARRRTVQLFLSPSAAAGSHGGGGGGASGHSAVPAEHVWIDNTAAVWDDVRAVLGAAAGVRRIAVDAGSPDIAFSSGLRAAELAELRRGLGRHWARRLVAAPTMLPVEVVATMVPGRLAWYRRLQETAWAAIGEAFSSAVITPGQTHDRGAHALPYSPSPALPAPGS